MPKKVKVLRDKYKSTTMIYPKVVKESLPEEYQELPETVENIPIVKANPVLAGTEGDLSSIQIGSTKYKVGGNGTSLRQINITIKNGANGELGITFFTTDEDVSISTIQDIIDFLPDSFDNNNSLYTTVTGYLDAIPSGGSVSHYSVIGIYKEFGSLYAHTVKYNGANNKLDVRIPDTVSMYVVSRYI